MVSNFIYYDLMLEMKLTFDEGLFITGAVVGGSTIKDNSLALFRKGAQNTSVEIFTGDVGAEGLPFVPLKESKLVSPNPGSWKDWTDDQIYDYIHSALSLMNNVTTQDILDLYRVQIPSI
jgi:hypothetical protein